ncbi:MAG: hypothetical protein B7X35_06370 [Halothiobacillus sp. 14-56-357]|jgi:uncharacterized protein YqiB (DUF1249 family)|uniref:DUF1249 domain-containing protein n=1 Tax=Halothiobacillus sp. 15-55-196 TaxID=1970382 RepID=UPI000BDCB21C|nr:DUF1249 domain-containing protein [Halothiobacillus sp. 15-55-196]OZB37345.1 MAG: hypothetical protein B7X44_01990 [Halothiobacillus sp. 15-55-196]OZB56273.1 MAG: hypothetical protein B7X35_06370 [Halothiobacillus sp. 14-56-357]OZB78689.1 MAG: hypothetical protein B7X29_03960 [Halothiobacillus sp. 13-55-115]
MNTKTQTPPFQHSGTFERLMDAYEQNYILMRRLFGDLKHLKSGDECPWDANITSKIIAKSKFTLDVQFTDQLVVGNKNRPLKLKVRVYHDARTAELLDPAHRNQCLQELTSKCTEQQFKRNRLLKNWLIKQVNILSGGYNLSMPE